MGDTFTDHDLRDQVTASLDGREAEFNVQGIVEEIQSAYGTVPIDAVPHFMYWNLIERHVKPEDAGDAES